MDLYYKLFHSSIIYSKGTDNAGTQKYFYCHLPVPFCKTDSTIER